MFFSLELQNFVSSGQHGRAFAARNVKMGRTVHEQSLINHEAMQSLCSIDNWSWQTLSAWQSLCSMASVTFFGLEGNQTGDNFLASLGHPFTFRIPIVALDPYGASGQSSKLLLAHLSEHLVVTYNRGAGRAWLLAAERCSTTMEAFQRT